MALARRRCQGYWTVDSGWRLEPMTMSEPCFAIESKNFGSMRGAMSRSPSCFAIESKNFGSMRGAMSRSPSRSSTKPPVEARKPALRALPFPAFFAISTGRHAAREACRDVKPSAYARIASALPSALPSSTGTSS